MNIYDEYDDEQEERHYHKKEKTPTKKHKKADHKHEYENCLIGYDREDFYGRDQHVFSKAKYCTICGKLTVDWLRTTIPLEGMRLPYFEVSMWDKTVNIE